MLQFCGSAASKTTALRLAPARRRQQHTGEVTLEEAAAPLPNTANTREGENPRRTERRQDMVLARPSRFA